MNVVETKVPATYEPTVQDKIQRILYRLEHGEKLTPNRLRNFDGTSYCVLGLFADESKMGRWCGCVYATDDGHLLDSGLSDAIYQHYGLNNRYGAFYYEDLPVELQEKLETLHNAYGDRSNYLTLSLINDYIGIHGKDSVNDILAQIIRSGVVFKKNN